MATPSLRSEFEQQLCVQLLGLSEVVEALVDRVLDLEERLQLLEGQQLEAATGFENAEQAGELLTASELKVRSLRNRLTPSTVTPSTVTPSTVIPLKPEAVNEARMDEQLTADQPSEDQSIDAQSMDDQSAEEAMSSSEMPIEAAADDEMEYVDDPQIDLLSA